MNEAAVYAVLHQAIRDHHTVTLALIGSGLHLVRLNHLHQVIWQIQRYWKLDPNNDTEDVRSVRFDFEAGHSVFHVADCTFILPTESEVAAAPVTAEDLGK